MSRLPAVQTETASGRARQLLEGVQAKLKITLNMTRVMGGPGFHIPQGDSK